MEINGTLILTPMPPKKAIKWFSKKVLLTAEEYYALEAEVRAMAFTVSRVIKMDMINSLFKEVTKAISKEQTYQEFSKAAGDLFDRRGFTGLTPNHLDTVYRNNTMSAYNVERHDAMIDNTEAFPNWAFSVILDDGTTEICEQLVNLVYPSDHSIFDQYYPPNHDKCRTSVGPVSRFEKVKVQDKMPTVKRKDSPLYGKTAPASDRFNTNPAVVPFKPDLDKYPVPIRDAFQAEQG